MAKSGSTLDVLSPDGGYALCLWLTVDLDVHEPDPENSDDPRGKLVSTLSHFVVDAGRDVEGWWLRVQPYDADDDRPDSNGLGDYIVDVAGVGPLDPLTRLRAFLEGRVD